MSLAACGDEEREGSVTVEGATGTETTGTGTTGTDTTGTDTQATVPGDAVAEALQISEVDFALEPAEFEVPPGVVQFAVSNDGEVVHALEVEGPTGDFETEEIQPGGRAQLKADVSQPGEYKLYCPIGDHEDRGMVGTLVVGGGGGGDGGGSGGTTTPDDEGGASGGGAVPEDEDDGGAGAGRARRRL